MKLIMTTLIVVLAAFLMTTSTIYAQPMNQESVAKFIVLEAEKTSYVLGDDGEVKIQFEVEYSGAEEEIVLEAEITVLDSTGNIVFESEDDYGEMIMTLRSGSSTTRRVSSLSLEKVKETHLMNGMKTTELLSRSARSPN